MAKPHEQVMKSIEATLQVKRKSQSELSAKVSETEKDLVKMKKELETVNDAVEVLKQFFEENRGVQV